MRRNIAILCASTIALTTAAAGCQRDNSFSLDEMEAVSKALDRIEKKLNSPGRPGAAGPGAAPRPVQAERPPEPDPKTVYSVPIDGNPILGAANATVTIVEGADFDCPHCRRGEATMERVRKEYGDKVRIAFKQYVVHPNTALAQALATCSAQAQGKFWEMKKAVWESTWTLEDDRPGRKAKDAFTKENMFKLAEAQGLDMAKFQAEYDGERCKNLIAQDRGIMERLGANGTPAFYVNGRPLLGAYPFESFKQLIDEEMAKAEAAISKGIKPEDYYATIVQAGKKTL
jgi:protein-disulfide isomerase